MLMRLSEALACREPFLVRRGESLEGDNAVVRDWNPCRARKFERIR